MRFTSQTARSASKRPSEQETRRPGQAGGGSRYGDDLVPLPQRAPADPSKFPNRIPAKVRDNGDMELAAGDRIRNDDFGEGRVDAITGEGAKRVAHVRFDTVGAKKLLVKIAPISKL